MSFDTWIQLFSHHHNEDIEKLGHSKEFPYLQSQSPPHYPLPTAAPINLISFFYSFAFSRMSQELKHIELDFCVWLFSLNEMLSRFIGVVAGICSCCFLLLSSEPLHNLFILWSVDKHSDCPGFEVIMKESAINIFMGALKYIYVLFPLVVALTWTVLCSTSFFFLFIFFFLAALGLHCDAWAFSFAERRLQ